MKLKSLFIVTLLVIVLSACSSQPPTVGQSTDFASACNKANDGKRIALTGYLRFPESFSGNSVVLRMYQASDFSGDPVGVQVDFGSAANQLAPVTDQYKDSDLKMHLNSGQDAAYGTPVKVSGTVYFPAVSQEFACALENPLVESAQ